jgi:hypothetical protein
VGQSLRPAGEQARRLHEEKCKAQTFFWLSRVRPRDYSKLIKEDHFACTTRMFEILVPFDTCRLRGSCSGRDRCPDRAVHQRVRTHILAAIRLFTCQRAQRSNTPNSSPSSADSSQTTVATFVTVVVIRAKGGGILSSFSAVSTGCREIFHASREASSSPRLTPV